jgi:hypothetical protein
MLIIGKGGFGIKTGLRVFTAGIKRAILTLLASIFGSKNLDFN